MAGITNTTASTMALATSAAGTMCPAHIQAKQASSATTPSDQVTPASTTPEPDARVDPAKEDWPIDPQLLGDAAAANTNLRLERAKANSEKKRKPEGKNAPSASKKQKTRADGLAIPDNANSIRYVSYFEAIPSVLMHLSRNISMRHWNAQQAGGQGLAADFDAYFKTLSHKDKEVMWIHWHPRSQSTLTTPPSTRSLSRKSCALSKALLYVLIIYV
jgi:hypothetical protein